MNSAARLNLSFRFQKVAVVVADDVVQVSVLYVALHVVEMRKAFVALGVFPGTSRLGSREANSIATRLALIILFFALPGCTLLPVISTSAEVPLKFS